MQDSPIDSCGPFNWTPSIEKASWINSLVCEPIIHDLKSIWTVRWPLSHSLRWIHAVSALNLDVDGMSQTKRTEWCSACHSWESSFLAMECKIMKPNIQRNLFQNGVLSWKESIFKWDKFNLQLSLKTLRDSYITCIHKNSMLLTVEFYMDFVFRTASSWFVPPIVPPSSNFIVFHKCARFETSLN